MTLGQKLDALNKEVRDYKIINASSQDIYGLSEKLYELLDIMDIDEAGKYYFRKYIEVYSMREVNDCIELCEESARVGESLPYKKFIKIKEKVEVAISLFKEVCEWYSSSILAKEIT